jgi:hypothetical protein
VLALSLGLWTGDRALLRQGALALLCSTALAAVAGAVVGWSLGGTIRFTAFQSLVVSGLISAGIGGVAGLSSADDVGRHYLIAVAAAAQYAIYPVWIGLSLTLGFPEGSTTLARLSALGINLTGLPDVCHASEAPRAVTSAGDADHLLGETFPTWPSRRDNRTAIPGTRRSVSPQPNARG